MKPSSKRRRDEEEQAREDREDGPRASGSGTRAGGAVEGGDEATKKKQRAEVVIPPQLNKDAPRVAQKEEQEPDYLLALVNINNSVASLARAVTASNDIGKLHCTIRTVYRMGTVYPSYTVR